MMQSIRVRESGKKAMRFRPSPASVQGQEDFPGRSLTNHVYAVENAFGQNFLIMPTLGYHTNVHNTALVVLQRKGYRVWSEQDGNVICAEKEGWDFMANDSVQLLGLVAIYENRRPSAYHEYWWRIRRPWLYDKISGIVPNYISVMKKK